MDYLYLSFILLAIMCGFLFVKKESHIAFKLLLFFLENRGRVQSRLQLLDGVWGRDSVIDERTVDVHVGRLRKALSVSDGDENISGSDDARDPIRTVRGGGYVFGQR